MKINFDRVILGTVLLFIGLFVSHCTRAADTNVNPNLSGAWNPTDKALFAGYVALTAFDAAQTDQCLHAGTCVETNPLFGDNPSTARLITTKLAVTGALLWAADALPQYRRALLIGADVFQCAIVAHNLSIGMSVKF